MKTTKLRKTFNQQTTISGRNMTLMKVRADVLRRNFNYLIVANLKTQEASSVIYSGLIQTVRQPVKVILICTLIFGGKYRVCYNYNTVSKNNQLNTLRKE